VTSFSKQPDLYHQLKDELDHFRISLHHEQGMRARCAKIYEISEHIGGVVLNEAECLRSDLERFLRGEISLQQLLEHLLTLEQETREL
jgi:hypothetical protein